MNKFYEDKPEYEFSSDVSEDEEALPWISWYCSLIGHEFFCEVDEEFIDDEFNLTGLSQMVNYYNEALDIILDIDTEESQEEKLEGSEIAMVEMSAEILYGLIHARYILTRAGLEQMALKYENADFGYCPRYYCQMTRVVPCGRTDVPECDTVRLYCPNCNDLYACPSSRFQTVDGAFFGTTFPHLFFDTYPELLPKRPTSNSMTVSNPSSASASTSVASIGANSGSNLIYVAKIFGFKVSDLSKTSSRMKWLRIRPDDIDADADVDVDADANANANAGAGAGAGANTSKGTAQNGTVSASVTSNPNPNSNATNSSVKTSDQVMNESAL